MLYSLQNYRPEPFTADTLRTTSTPGAVFLLDVPRVADPVRVCDQMKLAAKRMAHTLDADARRRQPAPARRRGAQLRSASRCAAPRRRSARSPHRAGQPARAGALRWLTPRRRGREESDRARRTSGERQRRAAVPPPRASPTLRATIEEHNRALLRASTRRRSPTREYDALFRELAGARGASTRRSRRRTRRRSGSAARRGPISRRSRHAMPMLSIRTETDTTAGAAASSTRACAAISGLPPTRRRSSTWPSSSSTASRSACATRRGRLAVGGDARRRRSRRGRHRATSARSAPIPRRLRGSAPPAVLEVRGEVYMTRARLRRAERAAAGGRREDASSTRATPRPAPCARSIRR